MDFSWYQFSELSSDQLYDILALRSKIFVVEQNCVYLDPDHRDQASFHLLGQVNHQLVAYLRVIPAKGSAPLSFGRIVIDPSYRRAGYAKLLMSEMLLFCRNYFPGESIHCSAQYYLKQFYESFGFVAHGDIYDEDGIDHISMRYTVDVARLEKSGH